MLKKHSQIGGFDLAGARVPLNRGHLSEGVKASHLHIVVLAHIRFLKNVY